MISFLLRKQNPISIFLTATWTRKDCITLILWSEEPLKIHKGSSCQLILLLRCKIKHTSQNTFWIYIIIYFNSYFWSSGYFHFGFEPFIQISCIPQGSLLNFKVYYIVKFHWKHATMAFMHVSPLGGSLDEIWQGEWIRKHSDLGICQNWVICDDTTRFRTKCHTKPPTDEAIRQWFKEIPAEWLGTCALRNGQAGRGHRPRLSSVCEKLLSGALRSQHIARAGNCRCLNQEYGAFCANAFPWKDNDCSFCRCWIPRVTILVSSLRGFPTAARGTRVLLLIWFSGDASCVW
jgi:hypothetical protein